MNKQFKKVISLILCSCMMASMMTAFAIDSKGIQTLKPMENYEITMDLESLPIFITSSSEANREEASEAISEALMSRQTNREYPSNSTSNDKFEENLSIATSDFTVIELSNSVKAELSANPLFAPTLSRIQEIANSGTIVKSVNFLMPEGYTYAAAANYDDPAYWEATCDFFWTLWRLSVPLCRS